MNRLSALFIISLLLPVAIMIVGGCAHPVTPSGGPRDTAPPVALHADPPFLSRGISPAEVHITFHEFIQLKELQKHLLVSPPMDPLPDAVLRGKTLIIRFHGSLQPNTTYTVYFGEAVVDITESNPLSNFSYVFSTGETLDSLTIVGIARDAFTLEPQEGVYAMAYQVHNDTLPADSLPLKIKPQYVSRTDKDGTFTMSHMKDQDYLVFLLDDLNSNLLFDLPDEKTGFADSLIRPWHIVRDTSVIPATDSLNLTGATQQDSGLLMPSPPPELELFMFTATDTLQRILRAYSEKPNTVLFAFRFPADTGTLRISCDAILPGQMVTELKCGKDTLQAWIKPPLPDTLLAVADFGYGISDTVALPLVRVSKGKPVPLVPPDSIALKISANLKAGQLDPFRPLIIESDYPLTGVDTSGIRLYTDLDTIVPSLKWAGNLFRTIRVAHDWEDRITYNLMIPSSSLTTWMGQRQDTIRFVFSVRPETEYGNLAINLTDTVSGSALILQLLDGKNQVVREALTTERGLIRLGHLLPGGYMLRAIVDRNANGRWDTGRFPGLQPERIFLYPETLQVRANWDLEEEWDLED